MTSFSQPAEVGSLHLLVEQRWMLFGHGVFYVSLIVATGLASTFGASFCPDMLQTVDKKRQNNTEPRRKRTMSGITNWSEALADPCFWAIHYALHTSGAIRHVEAFFGCSAEHCEAVLQDLYGEDDFETPLPPDTAYEYISASVLGFSFPENFTWMLEFGGYELSHQIYHPQVYPGGLPIAVESAHARLPGLRWAELKQMVACCLQPEWSEALDSQTLYPLLYTIVDPVTFAEYDEVRQTLSTAWEAVQIMNQQQLEQWLDVSISVYEKGRLLSYDAVQGWHDPSEPRSQDPEILQAPEPFSAGELWLPDPAGGWSTTWLESLRRDAGVFAPFFEMLDRHAQPHL